VRKLLLVVGLSLCGFVHTQIGVFPYSQSFSSVDPLNFTQDNSNWDFSDNSAWRSSNYSASIDEEKEYMYIRLSVKYGYTYKLSFWSKNICKLRLSVNDTPDQNSLPQPSTNININDSYCENGIWKKDSISYTPLYTGVMYFQIRADKIEDDDGYIDDILITETAPISLPISLLYFNVTSVGSYNRVNWSTASEFNNDYFLLDKSLDGYYFVPVVKVDGVFNSTSQLYYEVCDYILYNGILYYRLKQVDINGDETVFDIISVDNRLKVSPILLKVTNIMGQVVEDFKTSGILLYHYDDGSVIKRYIE
jgi:hypothetical protein